MNYCNQTLAKQWQAETGLLTVYFKLEYGPEGGVPDIQARAVWAQDTKTSLILHMGPGDKQVYIDHVFSQLNYMRGYFSRVSYSDPAGLDNMAVWGDFHFGERNYGHFEGVMVTFRQEHGVDDPCLDDPGGDDPCGDDPREPDDCSSNPICPPYQQPRGGYPEHELNISAANPCDLFPYIYMRAWPHLTQRERSAHFVTYSDQGDSDSLYVVLGQQRSAEGARETMQQTAVAFIDGISPWQGQWVDDLDPLKTEIRFFPKLYHLIYCPDKKPPVRSLARVVETLGLGPCTVLVDFLMSSDYLEELDRVWQNYFALVIVQGYRDDLLVSWTETLVVAHYLQLLVDTPKKQQNILLCEATHAAIILPDSVFPLPPLKAAPQSPPPASPGEVYPYAMGDLQMVRTGLTRYQPGDIASVLNLMPGETKETTTRRLQRLEENSGNDESVNHSISSSEEDGRDSLLRETLHTLADNILKTTYDGFDVQYGPPTTANLQGGWTMESKPNNTTPSKQDVTSFARKVLNATANRIKRHTRVFRNSARQQTDECIVSSKIKNDGSSVTRGIYRWLDKVYNIQVSRYGRRLLVQFLVTHPEDEALDPSDISWEYGGKVRSLQELGINSFSDVTPANYGQLAARYQVADITPPPVSMKTVSAVLQAEGERDIPVPPGYQADSATVIGTFPPDASSQKAAGLVGENSFSLSSSASPQVFPLQGEQETVAAALLSFALPDKPPVVRNPAVATVTLSCSLMSTSLDRWKIETYKALLDGYQNMLESQNQGDCGEEASGLNACENGHLRQVLLKQRCMNILFAQATRLSGETFVSYPENLAPPRYPTFFEQVFEWDHLSSGSALYGPSGSDNAASPLDRLLRVMVPVVPGQELRALYYLDAGVIWCCHPNVTPVHEQTVQTADQVRHQQNCCVPCKDTCVSWELVLPTSMKYLQEKSCLNGPAPTAGATTCVREEN